MQKWLGLIQNSKRDQIPHRTKSKQTNKHNHCHYSCLVLWSWQKKQKASTLKRKKVNDLYLQIWGHYMLKTLKFSIFKKAVKWFKRIQKNFRTQKSAYRDWGTGVKSIGCSSRPESKAQHPHDGLQAFVTPPLLIQSAWNTLFIKITINY